MAPMCQLGFNSRVDRMNSTEKPWMPGLADEAGVTAIEYGLLAALIAVAIIVALNATSVSVIAVFNYWSTQVIAAL